MTRKTHRKAYSNIAEAMRALGYTDEQLANEVQCDRTWITRVRGGRKLKTLSTPIRICRVLNIPIESLADIEAA